MLTIKSLQNTTVTNSGVEDEFPFLDFKKETGEIYRAFVQRDPEGNGPGFLFGLPSPIPDGDSQSWTKRYYAQAVGAKVTSIHESDIRDWEDFPALNVRKDFGDGQPDNKFEISCDEEGNAPGYLSVIEL